VGRWAVMGLQNLSWQVRSLPRLPGKEYTMKDNDISTLVLGCGKRLHQDAIHHDFTQHSPHVDIVHDLNHLPWPWESERFNKVIAESVLEHLYHNLLISMNEIWRITKVGGIAAIKLPYWRAEITWNDLTHVHRVGIGIMNQLDPSTSRGKEYEFYTPYKWKILYAKMNPEMTSIHWELEKLERWEGG